MLPTSEIVLTVAKLLRQHDLPLPVLDPVMQSSSGGELMAKAAVEIMVNELMPLTRVMTPNIPEAETLTGLRIINEDDMCEAAQKLRTMGARAVLVKGGHLEQRSEVRGQRAEHVDQIKDVQPFNEVSRQAIDVLDDQDQITVFREDWIDSRPVRGTGCVLSSAIAACLGQRMELREAVAAAKRFVIDIIRDAPKFGPNTDSFELTEMSVLKE